MSVQINPATAMAIMQTWTAGYELKDASTSEQCTAESALSRATRIDYDNSEPQRMTIHWGVPAREAHKYGNRSQWIKIQQRLEGGSVQQFAAVLSGKQPMPG